MAIAQSKVTAQGQISVPVEVRKRLGIGPGSVLEWDEEGGKIVVRRAGKFSSEDIHRALFPKGVPKPQTLEDLKEGIGEYIRERHARGRHQRSAPHHHQRTMSAKPLQQTSLPGTGLGCRSSRLRKQSGSSTPEFTNASTADQATAVGAVAESPGPHAPGFGCSDAGSRTLPFAASAWVFRLFDAAARQESRTPAARHL